MKVFEDVSDYDYHSDEDQNKENKKPLKTKQNTIRYESDEESSGQNNVPNEEIVECETNACQNGNEELKREEETDKTVTNGHTHYYTPFDIEKKDLKKVDSTSSTKVQCSSVDTSYSSKDIDNANLSRDFTSLDRAGSQLSDLEEAVVEDFESLPDEMTDFVHNVIVTNASVDLSCHAGDTGISGFNKTNLDALAEENNSLDTLDCIESHGLASPAMSACVSPASSNGGIYTVSKLVSIIL